MPAANILIEVTNQDPDVSTNHLDTDDAPRVPVTVFCRAAMQQVIEILPGNFVEMMDLIAALRTFVRITERGSFSAIAREHHTSVSWVTRQVARLEQHFEVRLFHRTTRRLSLTDDGHVLLARARRLLESTDEMEVVLGRQSAAPRGLVRLGTSVSGGMFLATRLPALLARHPGLAVELVMRDQNSDMVEDRLDLAFRRGEIADVSLVARRVGFFGRALVAAPVYLERNGAPCTPSDLLKHTCLIHDASAEPNTWRFTGPNGPQTVQVSGAFIANDSEAVRRAACDGYGIALLPEVQLIDDFRAGRLVRLLEDYPSQRVLVHIVYPSRRHLALRTRVVMDFVVEQMREITALLKGREGAELGTAQKIIDRCVCGDEAEQDAKRSIAPARNNAVPIQEVAGFGSCGV